jgi:phosphoglycerate-specific signal transduction histidine kinase
MILTWKNNQTASLDRIDSKLPYTYNNIQWIHKDINRMKNAYRQDYFIQLCGMVVNYNKN